MFCSFHRCLVKGRIQTQRVGESPRAGSRLPSVTHQAFRTNPPQQMERRKPDVGRGKIFCPGKGESAPPTFFSCHKSAKLRNNSLRSRRGRPDWRPRWGERPGPRQHSATFADPSRSHFPFPWAPLGGAGGRPDRPGKDVNPWGEHPQPACLLLSRPLATPHNKLSNAPVSASCERRPSQNRRRRSPLLRLSLKS